MSTEADFLRPIFADPDADGPRLVYADWREQCGDSARAEFIRVQCALAALPEDERERHPLREREQELIRRHRSEWLQSFIRLLGPIRRWLSGTPNWHADFRRGFVEILALNKDNYLRHSFALSRMTPVRELDCRGPTGPEVVDCLIACPQLGGLTALRVEPPEPADFHRLIECPFLGGLRELFLVGDVDPTCVFMLARSSLLERLCGLHLLGAARIDAAGIAPLIRAPAAQGLQELSLTGSALFSDLLIDFTAMPAPPQLRSLNLSGTRLGYNSLTDLLDWLPAPANRLAFSRIGVDSQAAASLAGSARLRQLHALDLSDNAIGDLGAIALADSPNLLGSTKLDLRANPISRRVKDALRIRCGHHVYV
jgi:uncharacterized protein (TIGR02996 family)